MYCKSVIIGNPVIANSRFFNFLPEKQHYGGPRNFSKEGEGEGEEFCKNLQIFIKFFKIIQNFIQKYVNFCF